MSGGIDIFGMVAGLGKSFGDSYAAARAQAQEDEAPALIQGLLKNYQSAGAPAAPALPTGAGPASASGAAGRSLPFFARAQGALPSEKLKGLIADVATKNELDPGYLSKLVSIESGGDPGAYNKGSGASGLGQFIPSTAKAYGLADPFDPVANLNATARFTLDNRNSLRTALGRDPTPGELYLGHQQGAGGAARLLRNPDMPAARLVGMKAVTSNGGRPDMTARDFAGLWTSRFDSDTPRIAQAAAPAAPAPVPAPAPGLPAFAQPGGPVRTMPATGVAAAAEPEADRPAPGAQPTQFVAPPGAGPAAAPVAPPAVPPPVAFGGFGSGASRMSPELATALTAAWRNPNTRAIATSVLGQVLAGKDSSWSIADLGNGRKALFDAKTARLVQLPGTGDSYTTETDAAGNQFNLNAATGKREVLIKAPDATSEERNFQRVLADPRFQAFLDAQRRPLTPTIAKPGDTVLPPGEYSTPSLVVPPVEKDERTAEQKDYEAAKKEGYTGTLVDFINMKGNANRAQTTINNAVNPVLKGLGEQFVEGAGAARASADSVRSIQNARAQLDAPGGIYSGAFAENQLALQKLGSFLGVADPAAIQNTETFRTQIKPIVLDTVKGLGAGSGISNADRDFALQAVGGDIKLDEGTIRRVLDITERAARSKIERHNTLADQMLETQPELKQVGPMLRVEPPAAQKPSAPSKAPPPKYGSVKIPMDAVRDLKGMPDTPETRAQFDGVFGEGAAARILGRAKQ